MLKKKSHAFGGNQTRAAELKFQCSTTKPKSLLPDAVHSVYSIFSSPEQKAPGELIV